MSRRNTAYRQKDLALVVERYSSLIFPDVPEVDQRRIGGTALGRWHASIFIHSARRAGKGESAGLWSPPLFRRLYVRGACPSTERSTDQHARQTALCSVAAVDIQWHGLEAFNPRLRSLCSKCLQTFGAESVEEVASCREGHTGSSKRAAACKFLAQHLVLPPFRRGRLGSRHRILHV